MANGTLLSEEVRRRRIQEDLLSDEGEQPDSEVVAPESEESSETEPTQEPIEEPVRIERAAQELPHPNDLSLDDYASVPERAPQIIAGLPGEQPEAPTPEKPKEQPPQPPPKPPSQSGIIPREAARPELAGPIHSNDYGLDDYAAGKVGFKEVQPIIDETGATVLPEQKVQEIPRPDVTKRARPAGQLETGFYHDEKPEDFIHGTATIFADQKDLDAYAVAKSHGLSDNQAFQIGDNGIGAKSLGGLSTPNLYGVAIPEEALRARYGNNYAAWRKARVDVVDPSTGIRSRLPIIDLGPGSGPQAHGVAIDFSPHVDALYDNRGGGKKYAIKLVDDAGPDVMKDPQLWHSEQAAIAQGIDSSALERGRQQFEPKGVNLRPLSDTELAKAQVQKVAGIARQNDVVSKLPETDKSPVMLYKRLDEPVEGVSLGFRRQYQGHLKTEIAKEAQQYYNEPDPQKAFERATADANFLTVGQEMGRKLGAFYGQVDVGINQAAQSIDSNRLDQFARLVHPEATPEQRGAFIKGIVDIKDPTERAQALGKLNAELEPAKQYIDMPGLADSADRIANPEYQRQQNIAITQKKAWIEDKLRQNPQLKGTLGEFVAEQGAQILGGASLAWLPPGIRESAFAAQIYGQAKDEFKRDHPDWTEQQINDAAGKSAFLQLAPQEVVGAAIGGRLGVVTAGITHPGARITSAVAAHMGVGTAGGVLQQIGANIAAGRPWDEGIPKAAALAAIQSFPGGLAAGVTHPPVRPRVSETAPERPAAPAEERAPEREPVVPERPPVLVTHEDAARRAYELYEERTKSGQPGTAYDDWIRAQKELNQATKPPPPTQGESEPWVSAIANRHTVARIARGELGDVIPGEGYSKEELRVRGLSMGPEEINRHVSDLMHNTGDPKLQAAAITAEEARLSQRSHAASRAWEAEPANHELRIAADNAFKDLTDFHNGPVAKLKNNWHAQGMTLQGEVPVDLTTFNGLREKFLRDVGKPPPTTFEPVLHKVAQKVNDSVEANNSALRNLGLAVETETARRRLPSADEVRTRIMERMRVDPCPR